MSRVVLQDLSDGATRLVDAPAPGASRSGLVIATQVSVVSAGTERMLVDFGRASLIGKARSQPQRVGEVIDKARTDGIPDTEDMCPMEPEDIDGSGADGLAAQRVLQGAIDSLESGTVIHL